MSAPYGNNTYDCTILRHIDADTTLIRAHGPWDIKLDMTVRWAGIDAPEMSTPEGRAALDVVNAWLPPGTVCMVRTDKDKKEKFGRYLGWFLSPTATYNERLVVEGYAVPYSGGKR